MALTCALYQPDIPQNAGTLIRLGACLDIGIEVIEPAGFRLTDAAVRRSGLDYREHANVVRHTSWDAFAQSCKSAGRRVVLLTRHADMPYTEFRFSLNDALLVGRESAGVPDGVRSQADATVTIPMRAGLRSLNVAVAAAIVIGEALRQTSAFPDYERGTSS